MFHRDTPPVGETKPKALQLPRLHSRLMLLAAASVLPLLLLSLVLGYFLVQHEIEVFRRTALGRNHTFLTALDAQLQGYIGTLRGLAAARSLESGDLRQFHADSLRVLSTQPDWRNILLLDASGQQLVNLRLPDGTPLPRETDAHLASFRTVVASQRLGIGQLGVGPVSSELGIAVRLPILRNGAVLYVVQFILKPEALARLLTLQKYPPTWPIGLLDANSRFIAREPFRPAGTGPSSALRGALSHAADSWFRGATLEGVDTYTALSTSELTKWSVAVAIPTSEIYSLAYRGAAALAAGVIGSLALAIFLARRAANRLTTPIGQLAAVAPCLGEPSTREVLDRIRAQPHFHELREVATALLQAQDSIMERESLRQRERDALREADKAKDEFLAMLGHELRNPLSAIVASAHVLRLSRGGAGTSFQAHEVIERQAQQMARLVEDLLDVSRLAMGKVTLRLARIDLAALAHRITQTWVGSRPGRERRTLCDVGSAWINADSGRVEQILVNLLDNAEKFSLEQGGFIRVTVHREQNHAVLQVEDKGQGVLAEDLPHIFDMFVQGRKNPHRAQGGIGLGLTLAHRFAQMHGGALTAASAGTGSGTTMTLRLPLAQPSPDTQTPSASVRPTSRRILVVEDNVDGRLMMQLMLTEEGHEVRAVASGLDAVTCVRDWLPAIALIDIGLPDIDGFEVARRIRASSIAEPPKLIAVSGYDQQDVVRSAYEAGFDLHLAKPVSPEFLRRVLGALTSPDPSQLRSATFAGRPSDRH